jgi:SAM-dependent methyltransferase
MTLDVGTLEAFYDSPLGALSQRLIGRVIRARWENGSGLTMAALGYGLPYLDSFRFEARRCVAFMPAEQGVIFWPGGDRCAVALVEAQVMPLPDSSVDRLLVAHVVEFAEQPDALLEEAWRVMAPEGRIMVIVPSRRGIWARADSTPYGHGLPYSKTQLRDLLHRTDFSPIFWGQALYAPPMARRFVSRSAPAIERLGSALSMPFAGVHIVEALKQIHRPVGNRPITRTAVLPRGPALVPSAHCQIPRDPGGFEIPLNANHAV